MEIWQMVVSICAGIVTIVTVFEKLGITKRVKKVDKDFSELKTLPAQVKSIQDQLNLFGELQMNQNEALLAILRNALYQSFKENRDIAAWTDDEANVQTKMHLAYNALHGNGEEELWWEKKKTWRIVSPEEYKELKRRAQQFC